MNKYEIDKTLSAEELFQLTDAIRNYPDLNNSIGQRIMNKVTHVNCFMRAVIDTIISSKDGIGKMISGKKIHADYDQIKKFYEDIEEELNKFLEFEKKR